MTCRFCQAMNSRLDHRCHRCGRRLMAAQVHAGPELFVNHGATAPDLAAHLASLATAVAEPAAEISEEAPRLRLHRVPFQQQLFTEGFSESGRATPYQAPAQPPAKAKRAPRKPKPPLTSFQQQLDLHPELDEIAPPLLQAPQAVEPAPRPTLAENDIETTAQSAPFAHRLLAAAYDASLMACAFVVFALVYAFLNWRLSDGFIARESWAIGPYLILAACVGLFYQGLFILGNGETPGAAWAGLRLVNFRGEAPTRQERTVRLAWSVFSLMAMGFGYLWAAVDQEQLTWHDLLSQTFATTRG